MIRSIIPKFFGDKKVETDPAVALLSDVMETFQNVKDTGIEVTYLKIKAGPNKPIERLIIDSNIDDDADDDTPPPLTEARVIELIMQQQATKNSA